MIQITKVRDVSIVDLCAADAFFVVAIPNILKQAIEMITPIDSRMIIPLAPICEKAKAESSRYPKLHRELVH